LMIESASSLLRIRSVSNQSCTENQDPHFMLNNFFLKIMTFMRQCGKIILTLRLTFALLSR
jgi:hypothetical protein